jgi:hypothetical protein
MGRHAGEATGGGLDEIEPVAIVEREASGRGEHGRYRVDGTAKRDFAEPIVPGAGDVDVTDGIHGPARGAFRVSVAAGIGNVYPQMLARFWVPSLPRQPSRERDREWMVGFAGSSLRLMNDLLYYEPLADLFEGDATYRDSTAQVKFGYLTLAASFHWNLLKLLGDVSPTYRLAPPGAGDGSTLAQLPYLDGALRLHVKSNGVPSADWLQHASAVLLAEVHSDCMPSLLHAGSADVASTLLSNVGHTVVIRVILNALRLAHRTTVEPAVLEEALSTLCLLSHRRYEGRIPELAVCFGPSRRRPGREEPSVCFGRQFLGSKKSAVLLKGGELLLYCLGNGRVVEVVDLNFEAPRPPSGRALGPLSQIATLNYSYDRGAVTAILTRQGEVLVAMGARICFSWEAGSWRLYPAERLGDRLRCLLTQVCAGTGKASPRHLAQHMTTMALTLREDRLGALVVVSSSDETIERLIRSRQANLSPVEALYSRLFVGRQLCDLSPQLACNAAALDGAVVIDKSGIVRGIGCIFETGRRRTAAEGARTRAALLGSKDGVALKISQDGEMSIFSDGKNEATMFAPVW